MLQLRVGGDWLRAQHRRANYSGLTLSERWPGGCFDMSWSMALPTGQRLPEVRRGAVTEAFWGDWPIWSGALDEPDWAAQSFAARGWSQLAADIPALTLDGSDLVTTTTPNYAVDTAIAQGWWGVTRPTSLGGTALSSGDETNDINSVGVLLTNAAGGQGMAWGVDEFRQTWMRAADTAPSWLMTPGSANLGVADDDYASHVFLRYSDSGSAGAYKTATASVSSALFDRFGFKAYSESLIDRGQMSTAAATAIAQGVLTSGRGQLGWADAIEANRYTLRTVGGLPASFALVRAGQVIRLQGLTDAMRDLGGSTYLDVVVAEKRWADGGQTATLAPLGYSRRQTLAGAFEELAAPWPRLEG